MVHGNEGRTASWVRTFMLRHYFSFGPSLVVRLRVGVVGNTSQQIQRQPLQMLAAPSSSLSVQLLIRAALEGFDVVARVATRGTVFGRMVLGLQE